jgi:hypothetical protein
MARQDFETAANPAGDGPKNQTGAFFSIESGCRSRLVNRMAPLTAPVLTSADIGRIISQANWQPNKTSLKERDKEQRS